VRCCKSRPGCTSGRAFRCETLHRASVYTNGTRIDREPVELSIASLRFSTGIASFAPVTVEVWDRLEAARPDSRSEFMVVGATMDPSHPLLGHDRAVACAGRSFPGMEPDGGPRRRRAHLH
jgi:hypothetical protein